MARVSDQSDAAVADGHTLTFSSLEGSFTASRVEVVKGVARTFMVWVPDTHPIVTVDAGSTMANLYVGPTPRGASTHRYFAGATGRPATAALPAASEELTFYNPLPASAVVRMRLYVQQRGVPVEQDVALVLAPRSHAVERLSTLVDGYPLIGVEVQSDVPVVTQRVTLQQVHGHTRTLGMTAGVDTLHPTYLLTPARGRTTLDLFNPAGVPVQAAVAVQVGGRTALAVPITLPSHGSARVEGGDLIAQARPSLRYGTVALLVHANGGVVVELDARPSSAPRLFHCASVRGNQILPSCAAHYVSG